MIHIVICDKNELNKIISKERTILIRGNTTRRIPNSRIFVNDELYFVEKGTTKISYHADVLNADSYRDLTEIELDRIFNKLKDKLNLSETEETKWKKKCLCIIEFDNFNKIDEIDIPKYSPVTDWIMVNDLKDLGDKYGK